MHIFKCAFSSQNSEQFDMQFSFVSAFSFYAVGWVTEGGDGIQPVKISASKPLGMRVNVNW